MRVRRAVAAFCLLMAVVVWQPVAYAANVVRAFTGLTGNTTGTVDAIDIADLVNGDIGIAMTGNVVYFYQYNSSATDATASPYFIRPHDYSTAGVWYLTGVSGGTISGKLAVVVNSDTASYSVTVAQAKAGTFFLTTNTATTTYTLPAAEAGMTVCARMSQGNAQVLRIDTDGTDYIVMSTGARTSAAGDYYTASSEDKNQVCVVAFNETDWYVTSEAGTWTEE